MNCSDFQETVQQFLDGDCMTPSDAFEEHRRGCPECRTTYVAAVELLRGLQLAPWPAPPPDLASRVVAEIQLERSRHTRRVRFGWAAALAAGILLAVASINFITGTDEPGASAPGESIATSTSPEPPATVSLSLDVRVAEAGSALTSLVESTARETVKQGQSLLPPTVSAPSLTGIDTMQLKLEPPTNSLRHAGQTLTASLEPVTSSARRAFLTFQDLSTVTGDESR